MGKEEQLNNLLQAISDCEKYNEAVFEGPGIYFAISRGELWEISNDASCSPKGGWFPDIVTGTTEEECEYIEKLMDELGFDDYFFDDLFMYLDEFNDNEIVEFFKEGEDEEAYELCQQIAEEIKSDESPFASFEDFVKKQRLRHLEHGKLYYEWEGDYIEFFDNICDTGEARGYYEKLSDDEWIEILENIEDHIVTA